MTTPREEAEFRVRVAVVVGCLVIIGIILLGIAVGIVRT